MLMIKSVSGPCWSKLLMNDRSILRQSIGRRCNSAKFEYPTPKSSTAMLNPMLRKSVNSWETLG